MTVQPYTTRLGAGLGLISETDKLIHLWEPGMDCRALLDRALDTGDFPTMTARRLRNIVFECFAPRFLVSDAQPAALLKSMQQFLSEEERMQLYFLFGF